MLGGSCLCFCQDWHAGTSPCGLPAVSGRGCLGATHPNIMGKGGCCLADYGTPRASDSLWQPVASLHLGLRMPGLLRSPCTVHLGRYRDLRAQLGHRENILAACHLPRWEGAVCSVQERTRLCLELSHVAGPYISCDQLLAAWAPSQAPAMQHCHLFAWLRTRQTLLDLGCIRPQSLVLTQLCFPVGAAPVTWGLLPPAPSLRSQGRAVGSDRGTRAPHAPAPPKSQQHGFLPVHPGR